MTVLDIVHQTNVIHPTTTTNTTTVATTTTNTTNTTHTCIPSQQQHTTTSTLPARHPAYFPFFFPPLQTPPPPPLPQQQQLPSSSSLQHDHNTDIIVNNTSTTVTTIPTSSSTKEYKNNDNSINSHSSSLNNINESSSKENINLVHQNMNHPGLHQYHHLQYPPHHQPHWFIPPQQLPSTPLPHHPHASYPIYHLTYHYYHPYNQYKPQKRKTHNATPLKSSTNESEKMKKISTNSTNHIKDSNPTTNSLLSNENFIDSDNTNTIITDTIFSNKDHSINISTSKSKTTEDQKYPHQTNTTTINSFISSSNTLVKRKLKSKRKKSLLRSLKIPRFSVQPTIFQLLSFKNTSTHAINSINSNNDDDYDPQQSLQNKDIKELLLSPTQAKLESFTENEKIDEPQHPSTYWCHYCGISSKTIRYMEGPWGENTLCEAHGLLAKGMKGKFLDLSSFVTTHNPLDHVAIVNINSKKNSNDDEDDDLIANSSLVASSVNGMCSTICTHYSIENKDDDGIRIKNNIDEDYSHQPKVDVIKNHSLNSHDDLNNISEPRNNEGDSTGKNMNEDVVMSVKSLENEQTLKEEKIPVTSLQSQENEQLLKEQNDAIILNASENQIDEVANTDDSGARIRPVLQEYCWGCVKKLTPNGCAVIMCDGCPKAYHRKCYSGGVIPADICLDETLKWFCSESCKEVKTEILVDLSDIPRLPFVIKKKPDLSKQKRKFNDGEDNHHHHDNNEKNKTKKSTLGTDSAVVVPDIEDHPIADTLVKDVQQQGSDKLIDVLSIASSLTSSRCPSPFALSDTSVSSVEGNIHDIQNVIYNDNYHAATHHNLNKKTKKRKSVVSGEGKVHKVEIIKKKPQVLKLSTNSNSLLRLKNEVQTVVHKSINPSTTTSCHSFKIRIKLTCSEKTVNDSSSSSSSCSNTNLINGSIHSVRLNQPTRPVKYPKQEIHVPNFEKLEDDYFDRYNIKFNFNEDSSTSSNSSMNNNGDSKFEKEEEEIKMQKDVSVRYDNIEIDEDLSDQVFMQRHAKYVKLESSNRLLTYYRFDDIPGK